MEYRTEDEETPAPPAPVKAKSKIAVRIGSISKTIISGVLLPIFVSVSVSFYVGTRLLKPKLKVRSAWGNASVAPLKGTSNEYLAVLLDLWPGLRGSASPEDYDARKPLVFTGGEIVAAKRISFKSAHDYVIDSHSLASRILKIMLTNDGYVTATRIRLAFECPDGTSYGPIVASPNIKFSEEHLAAFGSNAAVMRVEIDRLGASEKALLTATCEWRDAPPSTSGDKDPYFLTIHKDVRGSRDILYITSEEGNGEVDPEGMSLSEALRWEESNFPNTTVGFWAARLHAKSGITPSLQDVKGLQIPYEVEDDTGKITGSGTWRVNASSNEK